ncbi:peptidoglycan-binding protein [Streptomyces sp. NPDC096132]|uniref:peptidoglycan-binding domain-containing protein n=1 Tax=Streptomyces sp. NPDC096132 TaxID=3366075 RepID=UPI0037F1A71D
MSEPTGLVCPECGTPRAADGSPACSCARRAADVHLETRAAEAAAAEDFDPLRIRPFAEPSVAPEDAEDLPERGSSRDEPDGSQDLDAVPAPAADVAPLPTEQSPPPSSPPPPSASADGDQGGRRRPRRLVLTAGVAAAAAVAVTGGVLAALFTYQSPSRDGAGPDDVRASVPAGAAGTGTPSSTPSGTASPTQTSESPTASPSATPSESPATPTGSPGPTASPTGTGATATATSAPAPTQSGGQAPVLRPGDSGPEVTELQLRLEQAGFYDGEADGEFDGEVEDAVRGYQIARLVLADESGVYGKATRRSLESETSEP